MSHLTEQDVILPALLALRDLGDIANTTDIKNIVMNSIPLSADDMVVLPSGVIRIEQIIRNIKSHNVLEKLGYAIYDDGIWTITELGKNVDNDTVTKNARRISNLTLKPQTAMAKLAKEYTFKNKMEAAKTIRKGFDTLPKYKNDYDLLNAVRELIENYNNSNN